MPFNTADFIKKFIAFLFSPLLLIYSLFLKNESLDGLLLFSLHILNFQKFNLMCNLNRRSEFSEISTTFIRQYSFVGLELY